MPQASLAYSCAVTDPIIARELATCAHDGDKLTLLVRRFIAASLAESSDRDALLIAPAARLVEHLDAYAGRPGFISVTYTDPLVRETVSDMGGIEFGVRSAFTVKPTMSHKVTLRSINRSGPQVDLGCHTQISIAPPPPPPPPALFLDLVVFKILPSLPISCCKR